MSIAIYLIIILIFAIYIVWTWNSTEQFKQKSTKILFIIVGTLFISVLTLILFSFSKIGIEYPKLEMMKDVRKIILLVFIPINGFFILPQIANIVNIKMEESETNEQIRRRITKLGITLLGIIIIECMYFKNMQTGLINFYEVRKDL